MTALEGPQSPVLSLPSSSPLQQPQQQQQLVRPSDNSNVSRLVNFDHTSSPHHSGDQLPENPPVSPTAPHINDEASHQTDSSFHQEDPSSPTLSSPSSSPEHPNPRNYHAPGGSNTQITSSTTPSLSKPAVSTPKPSQFCPNCHRITQQNHRLDRRVARLRLRLHESTQTAQTHGQRLLRAAFQDKLREVTATHAHRTTDMLNIQKRCFEEELQAMEDATSSAIHVLQKLLADQRDERDQLIFRYERDRDDAAEKTDITMQAAQQKLSQMQATVVRVESEKAKLAAAHDEKKLMIDALTSNVATKDIERRRLAVLENGQEEERKRKNSLIDSLQVEISLLRKQLDTEAEQSRKMTSTVARLERERRDEHQKFEQELEDCKQESKTQVDRMGRLLASMIEDVAQVPSDLTSTN